MEIEVSEADCVSLQQKRSNLAKGVYSKCYEPRTLLREEYRVLARQYSKTIPRVPIRTQNSELRRLMVYFDLDVGLLYPLDFYA